VVARGLIRPPRDANLDGDRQRAGCPHGGRTGLDDRIPSTITDEDVALTAEGMADDALAILAFFCTFPDRAARA
jgi:hypothetical protein